MSYLEITTPYTAAQKEYENYEFHDVVNTFLTGVVFKNCTFNIRPDKSLLNDNTFIDCTFRGLWRESTFNYTVIENCLFAHCNLTGSLFILASLTDCSFIDSNLTGCMMSSAALKNIDVDTDTIGWRLACPDTGSFIGWKKAYSTESSEELKSWIVKLEIPNCAKRSSATTRKCRASQAFVLDIQDMDGNSYPNIEVVSSWDNDFTYRVGETVVPNSWDDNRWAECSSGIHFFITREEAVKYKY